MPHCSLEQRSLNFNKLIIYKFSSLESRNVALIQAISTHVLLSVQ